MSAHVTAFAVALTALSALAAGCARDGAPPVAPVEVAVADLGDAGVTSIAIAAPLGSEPRDRCTARLTAGTINTGSGCSLDERISKGPGLLSYPCSGSGAVEAVFGEHRFEGAMTDGAMILNLTTEIDWEDGCHWETKQRIRGDLRAGAKNATLGWTYSEGPVSGTSCYGACKASTDIGVEALSSGGSGRGR